MTIFWQVFFAIIAAAIAIPTVLFVGGMLFAGVQNALERRRMIRWRREQMLRQRVDEKARYEKERELATAWIAMKEGAK